MELLFGWNCLNILLEDAQCQGVVIEKDGGNEGNLRMPYSNSSGRRGADWLEKLCAQSTILLMGGYGGYRRPGGSAQ